MEQAYYPWLAKGTEYQNTILFVKGSENGKKDMFYQLKKNAKY